MSCWLASSSQRAWWIALAVRLADGCLGSACLRVGEAGSAVCSADGSGSAWRLAVSSMRTMVTRLGGEICMMGNYERMGARQGREMSKERKQRAKQMQGELDLPSFPKSCVRTPLLSTPSQVPLPPCPLHGHQATITKARSIKNSRNDAQM